MSIAARRLFRAGQAPTDSIDEVTVGALPVGQAVYSIPAGALFVSPSGNDTSGTGSIGTPYKTLTKAVSSVANSGTIIMREGIYNEGGATGSGMQYGVTVPSGRTNVTIQNYPNEAVWMEGVTPVTGFTASGTTWSVNYVARYDCTPNFGRGSNEDSREGWGWLNTTVYPCAHWSSQVVLRDANGDDTVLTPVPTVEDVVAGTFTWEHTFPYPGVTSGTNHQWLMVTSKLHIGTNPAGKTVLVTNKSTALLTLGQGATVQGIGVRYYGTAVCDWGTISARQDSTFENIHVHDCTGLGTSALSSGVTWRLSTIEDIGALGAHGNNSNNYTFDRVIVRRANNRHFNYAPACAGIKVSKMRGFTVTGCLFEEVYANIIWTDMSTQNAVVIGNQFLSSERRGFVFELSDGLILANNHFIDIGSDGLYLEPSDKLRVWNNTFHDLGWGTDRFNGSALNGMGVRNVNGDRKPPPQAGSICTAPSDGWSEFWDGRYTAPDPNMTWECHQFEFCNNVISLPKYRAVTYMEDYQSPYELSWADTNPVTGGNLYYYPSIGSYRFVGTRSDGTGHRVMQSLAQVASNASAEGIPTQEVGSAETSTVPVVDGEVTTAAKALVTPRPLPSDIASLLGVPTGTARLGAWHD